ncbi:hypothetical protein E2C01_091883 [Portunus trituberculatus]|uniref:Uncharacterized protein n=1 Tax=Portunus trituberculatus TaxID=210409 RepID=A0A5B7JWC7_PORTR|nr:hypothetical protein [Portunus trituberculatus]
MIVRLRCKAPPLCFTNQLCHIHDYVLHRGSLLDSARQTRPADDGEGDRGHFAAIRE